MENKTILITGASSGVGYQSALQLAEKGHTVIALARNAELLNQLSSASNGTILSFSHDLSSLNFDALLTFLKEKSIDKIDVLIKTALIVKKAVITPVVKEEGFTNIKPDNNNLDSLKNYLKVIIIILIFFYICRVYSE